MKRIAPITFTRAEYGSFLPVLNALRDEPSVETQLIVSGTHLSPQFGNTVRQIEADGFHIAARVPMPVETDSPEAVAKAVGVATAGLAETFARLNPDIVLLVGDRIELLAAATAALAFRIPVAHISGGDVTEGAIDNQVRHAVTQMSHLHFVAMQEHADRLLRMGEEPWRVHVTGEPALDTLRTFRPLSRDELSKSLGIELRPPVVVVTHHPTTLGTVDAGTEISALLGALEKLDATLVITMPNADVGGQTILVRLREFAARHRSAHLFESLGQVRYYSLLSHADLMLGNSSSGIWESPSFRIPVVNIGDRQKGRLRARNVIDTGCSEEEITAGIRTALNPELKPLFADIVNPYGDGHASERIASALSKIDISPKLLVKRFHVQD